MSITHHVIANSGDEISVHVGIVKIIVDICVLKITSDKKRSNKFIFCVACTGRGEKDSVVEILQNKETICGCAVTSHGRESRIVLDSGFHAVYSGSRIPKPRIQDSISKILPDSGFKNKKFHGFPYLGRDDSRRDVLCDL